MSFLIDRLLQQYDIRRYKNEKLLEARKTEVYSKIPGVSDLADTISKKNRELLRCFEDQESDEKNKEIAALTARKRRLLKENGYAENYLDPIYDCPHCRDTGTDQNTLSRCECFEKALLNEKYRELGANKNISFEDFDFSIFPDTKEAIPGKGLTQRQNMKIIYDACVKYADSFPQTAKPNMVFIGAAGLGKTYLLKCVAKRVIQRGFGCIYVTSYNLFDALKKQYLSESSNAEDFYETPFLIVDDLGVEPLMNNITSESLFNLLNARKNAELHTLIATNLSLGNLIERYGERIPSRLLSVEDADSFVFEGDDVRFIKKKP